MTHAGGLCLSDIENDYILLETLFFWDNNLFFYNLSLYDHCVMI